MKELIKEFPNQLRESINISRLFELKIERTINNIVLCGLGGSGIGGEIVKTWTRNTSNMPIEVVHGYTLPSYVSQNTLVILSSYSGNTEETLACLEEAISRKSLILSVTSGGQLKEKTNKVGAQCITIPGGLPPRSALGYSLVQLAGIFCQLNLADVEILEKINRASRFIEERQNEIMMLAENLLENSKSLNLIFYGEDILAPILLRACQQMNENSKELAFYNVIPEMNHNEIVGWGADPGKFYTIFIRSQFENSRNKHRLNITSEIISGKTKNVHSLKGVGENSIEESFYLIHLFDWLSFLKGEKKGVDVTEVNIIDYLKSQLGKN